MSDLFKDQRPELSDDEDRRLWQRVRTIPDEAQPQPAPARAPWWRALWTMPAVRYGAPAFAVLVAATVWVVQRAPEPSLRAPSAAGTHATAQTQPAAPPVAPEEARPLPTTQNRKAEPVVLRDERVGAAAPTDEKQNANESVREQAQVLSAPSAGATREEETAARAKDSPEPPSPAPSVALRKEKSATGFAMPPAGDVSGGAARMEQKKSESDAGKATPLRPPSSQDARLATPAPAPAGNVVSDRLLVLPTPAGLVTSRLAAGSLPKGSDLAAHPLVRSAAGPGSLSAVVPFPEESGLDQEAVIRLPALRGEREDEVPLGAGSQRYARFEDAPPRLQAAVLALALERALAHPEDTSRPRIESMLGRARKVAKAADASARPGAERLVRLFEGALKGWPAD